MQYALHPQSGYPSSLALEIEYALSDQGLRVTVAANDGPEPCPYGAGAHPYLTVGTPTVDTAILRAPARTVQRSDERGIPIGKATVEGTDFDFRAERPIGGTVLDTPISSATRTGARASSFGIPTAAASRSGSTRTTHTRCSSPATHFPTPPGVASRSSR